MIPDNYEIDIDLSTTASVPDELKNAVKKEEISEKQAMEIVSDSVADQIQQLFTDNLNELSIAVKEPDSD